MSARHASRTNEVLEGAAGGVCHVQFNVCQPFQIAGGPMIFFVKKFISQFLMPIPLVCELFLFGWLLTRYSKYKRSGRYVSGLAIVLFFVFGYGMGANRYLFNLERCYPPIEWAPADYEAVQGAAIVVLGQGLPENSDLPLRYQAGASFHQRLQEGMRLYRKVPSANLFISLAGDLDVRLKEQFVDEYAREHALKRGGMHLITTARDTSDEARCALDLAKTNRIIIVTSASHLPRAVKIFSKELVRRQMPYSIYRSTVLPKRGNEQLLNTTLIPAPCDYMYEASPDFGFTFRLWALPLPSVDGFGRMQHAIYEGLGNLFENIMK